MKIPIFFVMFILIGAFFIISNNNLHLGNAAEFDKFASNYYSWFFKIFDNAGSVTGSVVSLNWLPSSVQQAETNLSVQQSATNLSVQKLEVNSSIQQSNQTETNSSAQLINQTETNSSS